MMNTFPALTALEIQTEKDSDLLTQMGLCDPRVLSTQGLSEMDAVLYNAFIATLLSQIGNAVQLRSRYFEAKRNLSFNELEALTARYNNM